MTRHETMLLRWRDWMIENVPNTVLEPRVKSLLAMVRHRDIEFLFAATNSRMNDVLPSNALNFFFWSRAVARHEEKHGIYGSWNLSSAGRAVSDYMAQWFGPDWVDVLDDFAEGFATPVANEEDTTDDD